MSDSDSSEDEANDQLLAAVDSTFLCDKLYKPSSTVAKTEKRDEGVKSTSVPCAAEGQLVPKSNRYLLEEDALFHSDLNVSAAVQKHIAEKLSTLISSVIEFDDSANNQQHSPLLDTSTTKTGVQLLKGFTEVIDLNTEPEVITILKPKPITRRKIDEASKEMTRTQEIASSICDPSAFPKEVQHWKGPRKRSIVYQYQKKPDGSLLETNDLQRNEFTKARLANHWNESKIRNFKKHKQNGKSN